MGLCQDGDWGVLVTSCSTGTTPILSLYELEGWETFPVGDVLTG